jgi:hypothetical protein
LTHTVKLHKLNKSTSLDNGTHSKTSQTSLDDMVKDTHRKTSQTQHQFHKTLKTFAFGTALPSASKAIWSRIVPNEIK